jgi:hypothetical protein
MRTVIRSLVIMLALIILLAAIGWLGLRVKAASFPAIGPGDALGMKPLSANLPAPVLRFARTLYGESIPDIESAIVVGQAQLAPVGFAMPSRFRFYYDALRSSHYHDIEVTWFTLPFMHIHERNLEGHARLDLSILGQVDDAPKTNRASVQGYWAEVLAWLPAITLTDNRLQWETVDENTARLYLPGLDDVEALTVRFDAQTNLITEVETMRYQNETHLERWRWYNRTLEWGTVDGQPIPVRSQTQWNDSPPWATWQIEQVALNVGVAARLAQFGNDMS